MKETNTLSEIYSVTTRIKWKRTSETKQFTFIGDCADHLGNRRISKCLNLCVAKMDFMYPAGPSDRNSKNSLQFICIIIYLCFNKKIEKKHLFHKKCLFCFSFRGNFIWLHKLLRCIRGFFDSYRSWSEKQKRVLSIYFQNMIVSFNRILKLHI